MAPRLDIAFPSQGLDCSAWLYLPEGGRPAPVIVMAHGLGSVRGMRLDAFAERFCAAGYACLVFDYRHFGDSEGHPRQLLDIKKQLQDWKAAIAYARSRSDVDSRRVIIWGTSFSGGHVLSIAADDPKLVAVISQCPFTDGLASSLATPPLTSLKVTALALRDQFSAWTGGKPVMVASAGKPGSTALMAAPDCEAGYLGLVPERKPTTFQNRVAARIALQITGYYPGKRTPQITAPVLFCVCAEDSVAPAKQTLAHAKRAPKGEVKVYQDGHFDIYVGQPFEHVVRDQLAFLERAVPLNQGH
ncbi:alpha/beta hydrolase [Caulobacter segnis]|uniref:Alpha/beta hydrolase n=1 Tax=Caulobacter segnis TaxID=88688 RepID=A0A2W5V295_9CAUL|nr:alpha/beta hydrolase [Caulobacter segnis]PZR32827.1 MAG: alpha/beta hydrolase [Caulobacter segnis]